MYPRIQANTKSNDSSIFMIINCFFEVLWISQNVSWFLAHLYVYKNTAICSVLGKITGIGNASLIISISFGKNFEELKI